MERGTAEGLLWVMLFAIVALLACNIAWSIAFYYTVKALS